MIRLDYDESLMRARSIAPGFSVLLLSHNCSDEMQIHLRGVSGDRVMTVAKRFVTIAASAAIMASISGVNARAESHKLDAHAQATRATSEMDIRKQCYAEAKNRWPSSSQDLQTARDYAARDCMFDHGIRNP
jgi:hypothetical protein